MSETFQSPDDIRTLFSKAMSDMYRREVPQYGVLLELVADVNAATRKASPDLDRRLIQNDEIQRLDLERHGAIRLGTPAELHTIRRLFEIMGMVPVGYYDLSVAGVPVHATAFRPVGADALRKNPFRMFTSLLRLDLIEDTGLRDEAEAILARRSIFTPDCLRLIEVAETTGGLTEEQAADFVTESVETFRWHQNATVSAQTYRRLRSAHPLIADVVSFKGPHINHLTPRTLDIETVQGEMPRRGITAKAVIEGPPQRRVPILLRQTSFKALEEAIAFPKEATGAFENGTHTARFGEIEQRGAALTPKGRDLYDELLLKARTEVPASGQKSTQYDQALRSHFETFPDDEYALWSQGLAYFRYFATAKPSNDSAASFDELVEAGCIGFEPITYEDFLPVSAAGIFQSNLGKESGDSFDESPNQQAFEEALGGHVLDQFEHYERLEEESKREAMRSIQDR